MRQKLLSSFRLRVVMLVAILCSAFTGTVWGQASVGTTLWSEDWTNATTATSGNNNATPSANYGKGTTVYDNGTVTYTQSENTVYVRNEKLAGGNEPELMLSSGKTWTISNIPTGGATELTLTYKSNNTKSSVTCSTTGTVISGSSKSYTITTGGAENITLVFTCTGNTRIDDISLSVKTAGSGTGSETVATPIFNPASGAVEEGTVVTISSATEGATIYYTTGGSTPSASNGTQGNTVTINSATTIKAIAVKDGMNDSQVAEASYTIKQVVKGYTIDFENTLDCYVDWTMNNIGIHTSGVTSAHGGSAWGSNVNDNDNATTTAYIQTKEKVAYPDVFTCYISKESGNTTTSSWKIQVSSNGSTWNDIATLSSMTQNTWTEFSGNIKSAGYTDVYVRLYYSGSNAKRAVDDISLTTYTPAAVEAPSIDVPSEFTISTTATITCVTEGATIYYSYDNNTWREYTGELTINETKTIYAKAVKGTDESTIAQATATKLLVTPTVEISATSFNIGETATVTTDGPAVTLTTSAAGVASVSGTTVTGVAAGTATITATWAANSDYNGGTEEFMVIVIDPNAPGSVNNPYTVAQALEIIEGLEDGAKTDNEVYVAGTITQIDEVSTTYHNATYWISNDGGTTKLEVYHGKYLNNANFTSSDQIKVNDQVVVYGKLQKYVKNSVVTPEIASDNYIYNLVREKEDPTIVVNSTETVTYGSIFTVDDTMIEGGDITVTSSNTAVATVSGLVVTPVAVGTTIITVETEANDTYKAGSETFTLTVTQPAGSTTAPTGSAGGSIFKETFASSTGTNNDFGASTTSDGNGTFTSDEGNAWIVNNAYGANGAAKFGASKKTGLATSPSINATVGTTYTLTFKAAPWANESTTMNVSVDGGTISGISEDAMSTGEWNDFTASITATAASFTVTFEATKNRFFLDEVEITAPSSPAPAITATLNGSGYATFCSEYPLDFSDYETADYSAWQITDISAENVITFSQVKGSVKGGTGLLLKGEANATVSLTSVNSTNELGGNYLEGTLAPTYVEANKYYGLSGDKFVKVKAGTVKAGKALLNADWITEGSSARQITFIFEDDNTTTGISEELRVKNEESFYNLNGQRVNDLKKGGLYIVGGKKFIVK